jgi:lysophospholipid acyltransferase (LPLAT)-like uncharacterized protein
LLLGGISALSVLVTAVIGRTLRWRVDGIDHLQYDGSPRRPIMAFWHSRLLPATYYFRDRGIVVMISETFAGEWIARVVRFFGYGTSRGATSSRGAVALRDQARPKAAGSTAGIAVDGPSGPPRHVKPGVVWLGMLTGNPVVPFHMEASRSWRLRSWDRTEVPRPFATVALVVGRPIDVPPDADDDAIESKRLEVQSALERLERRAQELLQD